MITQMTIGKKLYLSFGAALALTLIISFLALHSIGKLGSTMQSVIALDARKQFLAGEADVVLSDFLAEERGIIRAAETHDKPSLAKYIKDFQDSADRMKKRLDEFKPLVYTEEGQRALDQVQAGVQSVLSAHEEFLRSAQSGDSRGASAFLRDKLAPQLESTNASAEKLVEYQAEQMKSKQKEAEASVSETRWLTAVMIGLSFLVGLVVVFIVRQINRSLHRTVTSLSESAEQVASAASQVSSSSQSLAQGSSEQAASLEETSASSEEINSMARKNSENSRGAAGLVEQSQQNFAQARQSLDQMVTAMTEINAQSDKISKIIKVIDEIAFQTNILALNAAVEAARAGEAGMGFAVVADEVRNLAQRCAQAAKDTAGLIEESISKSTEGKNKVDHVSAAILVIAEESAKVKTLVDEVNLGSQEQARGIEQVGKAIAQMEQVTQSTAANAEESAAAAEELTAQSGALLEIVEQLGAMVGSHIKRARTSRHAGAKRQRASHPATAVKTPVPATKPALAKPGPEMHKDAFPMDEEFKEF
ncbi:MAG TPA: methyl-accepting chemotaxis protein [Bryobacteraceae bacterium]|nr:methyl-accepting chemotaxis protein [Bryobacteraceae bacterium]